MARMRGSWAIFVLAPLGVLLADGKASAADPLAGAGNGASLNLRPSVRIDTYGRALEDVCPETSPGGRRCFAQRIVPPTRAPAPASARKPFGTNSDPNCRSSGGGGFGGIPSGSMVPSDVLARYNIPASSSAGGKIVALVELPSVHGLADVNAYRAAFGIPALPTCPTNASGVPTPGGTACFARVGEDGTVNSVTSNDCPGWSGETGLDMDMVSAACPDCSIVLVEANSTNDLDAMNQVAATVVGASAVSNSWGAPESGSDDQTPYSSSGILTLAASGDSGYLNEAEGAMQANFPASSIYVLAVGGTTLEKSGGSYSEVVWNDGSMGGAGGSGCSIDFSTPSWQSSSGFSFGTCGQRASVDVSAAAEFSPSSSGGGIAAYDADDGGWNAVVGTSAASPLVAAIMVRIGLGGADQHGLLYGHISDFNDVTSGTNAVTRSCSGVMCNAGTGWDGPSGLGTPNATLLAALGTAPPPPPPPTDAGTGGHDSGGGTTPPGDSGSTTGPDGGSSPPPPSDAGPPPGSLGAPCSGASDCNDKLCVAPHSGAGGSCSQTCDSTNPCPANFDCNGGYCFASGVSNDLGGPGSSGGCTTSPSSSDAGAGWLVLGLLLFTKRRRPRK